MKWEKIGITTKNARQSLNHAIIITIVGVFVIVAIGYFMGFKPLQIDSMWVAYYIILSVPLQEIIFRGFLQTRLYSYGRGKAIVLAAILFAAMHFISPLLVGLTLAAGLAWGYSFSRYKTLIGPITSHVVLGLLLFILVLNPPI